MSNHCGYAIADPDDMADDMADSDVTGEFRRLTDALGSEQLAVTLIRVPPHADFEQGTGQSGVKSFFATPDPGTAKKDLTPWLGDKAVEPWALSLNLGRSNANKVDDFWEAAPEARR